MCFLPHWATFHGIRAIYENKNLSDWITFQNLFAKRKNTLESDSILSLWAIPTDPTIIKIISQSSGPQLRATHKIAAGHLQESEANAPEFKDSLWSTRQTSNKIFIHQSSPKHCRNLKYFIKCVLIWGGKNLQKCPFIDSWINYSTSREC